MQGGVDAQKDHPDVRSLLITDVDVRSLMLFIISTER